MPTIYTKEICQLEALKYTSRKDFRCYSKNIYDVACKKKWLDEICSHMKGRVKRKAGWWDNIDNCKKEALLYNTPTELRKAEKGCYSKIILMKWQNICFTHMKCQTREHTVDDLKRLALKCKTYKEFRERYSGAYASARLKGILDDICQHMPPRRKGTKYEIPLTKENCKHIALKFETKSDFQKYEKGRWYNYAIRHNIKDEVCSHMRVRGNKKKRCIYVAKFSDNSIYVGLTCDTKRRWSDHLYEKVSSVYLHMQETGLPPIFEIVHDFVDVEKAQKLEAEYEQKYIEEGWNVLNRATPGAIGSSNGYTKQEVLEVARQYTTLKEFRENAAGYYEAGYRSDYWDEVRAICKPQLHTAYTQHELIKIALQYTNRTEFYHGTHGAYEAAKRIGILDEICSHMSKSERHRWSNDEIFKAALQCETKKEFSTRFPKEYAAACHRKIIKDCCEHMKPAVLQPIKWTDEVIANESKKYKTLKEFRKYSPHAYYAAKRRNKLDECCSHMLSESIGYLCDTLEDAFSLALKCQNRTEFKKKYNKAYEMLRTKNKLDSACIHMVKYKRPIQKWTPEARAIAAKQCKTRKEFHDKYSWAHHLASKNEGELERICAHMVKYKK